METNQALIEEKKTSLVSGGSGRRKLISLVVPAYNEEKNIPLFYTEIKKIINSLPVYDWELIFVNDGSRDKSAEEIEKLESKDKTVKLLDFSRNFGKEIALTAGLNRCKGDACIMLDADLQHPIDRIPDFLERWEHGMEVVIGVREKSSWEGVMKKWGSILFYKLINRITDTKVIPNATDFRLVDRQVIDEFNRLSEKNRMTRALIDWLGFRQEFIYFKANDRINGVASYSVAKLMKLAFNSMVSLSLFPLRIAGYLGVIITLFSGALGLFILITQYVLHADTFNPIAMLAVVIMFLVGIVLISLGLIAMYIAHIHDEVVRRPLYIIRKSKKEND